MIWSMRVQYVIYIMKRDRTIACDVKYRSTQIMLLNFRFRLKIYEGGSICNENPFITPSTNALGFCAIYQTKDQSIAVIMVQETLFYLSKLIKLQTF